jgi:hypothetical protein
MNETNLTEDEIIQDFLESVGATEKDIIKRGNRAVDLSTIPQSEHHLYAQRDVVVPPEVWQILATFEYPITVEQARQVEKMMDEFHDIAKPYGIEMSPEIYETGEPDYTCELVKQGFVTGFSYLHVPLDE